MDLVSDRGREDLTCHDGVVRVSLTTGAGLGHLMAVLTEAVKSK